MHFFLFSFKHFSKNNLWINFLFSDTFDKHQTFELHEARGILTQPGFDSQRKTVIYSHGYIESMSSQSIHVIVDAYLKRGDHNIILFDWSELADGNYFIDAVPNLKYVSEIGIINGSFENIC